MGRWRTIGKTVLLTFLLVCPAGAALGNLIANGDFATDASAWALIGHGAANWFGYGGWNDNGGCFWLNHMPQQVAETSQLVSGLVPGQTYDVSGYYNSWALWYSGPSFQVLTDDVIRFQGGHSGFVTNWTPFAFSFQAEDSEVLLRFQGQVGSDSDYRIDHIVMVPEPAAAILLGIAGLGLVRRRRRA